MFLSKIAHSISRTMTHKRGAFILFEGIDRSGKSTQCKNLAEFLNKEGYPTEALRFPDRTTSIGSILNSYLTNAKEIDDRAVHLLFSANRWECREKLLDLLNKGINIVVDRYAMSGVAFTNAKGVPLEWCIAPDRGLPAPDLVLYFNLSVEEAQKRGDFGNERYEKLDFQIKVKQIYEEHLMNYGYKAISKNLGWKTVDAAKPIEKVETEVRELALAALTEISTESFPISSLWV
eukprot:TRINITY_DN3390_c0_g1_i1.p1 TRINITY_DN3390_c0_g1~~TRINITY_DN3390_c0_g1_i1.p1  ORF type:complete len:234 (-),score=38.86 TRINITY_DN3390_c0_g1_i1:174-875(-)